MLDLGFVSAILPNYTLDEVVSFASENDFKCVEVMCWPKGKEDKRRYAGITHIDLDTLADQMSYIQNLLSHKNIYISGLGYYPNPLDSDDKNAQVYIAHIKKLIHSAKNLGIPVINTFIGRDPQRNINYNLGRFKEVWSDIIKVAEEADINVGIENCPMLFTQDEWPGGKNLAISPAIWDKMFDMLPSENLGLNYDPSHLVWMQMNEVQPIYDYSDKLFHIHLKDVKVHRDKLDRVGILAYPLEYHSPKIPGLGDVRWRDFFSALTAVGYKGPVCIEVEDKAFESSEEDIHSAILTSKNYLQQFIT